jgi:hypothetical protein
MENQYHIFWVCVCSLSYAAGKSHYFCTALYCQLWTVWLYHIFPHYLINSKIFGKNLLIIRCEFWFSLQLLSVTFLIRRIIQWGIIIVHMFLSTHHSCQILRKPRFWNILKTYSNIKFHENPASRSWVVPCRGTDRETDKHDKAHSYFRNFANASKNGNFMTSLKTLLVNKVIANVQWTARH